ncbi:MAG TPA: glycosyltransferase family 4 protein [Steroidobacteraceae bacterium]
MKSDSRTARRARRPGIAENPRIYWLTETFYPPQIGGVEFIASHLSHGLVATGLEVHVITRKPETSCLREESIDGVHVRRIDPSGLSKGKGLRALPAMLSFLARLTFMLIHEARCYDVLIVSGMKIIPLAAVPIAALFGKRCIIRIESTAELQEPVSRQSLRSMHGGLSRALQNVSAWLQRKMLLHADRVVAISDVVHRRLLRMGLPEEKISQIPNAIDLSQFHPVSRAERDRLRAELSLPHGATILLFAARLSRAKGIELLVKAWPRILVQHPELFLVIVGSGDGAFDACETEIAESIRRSGRAGERIRMIGVSQRVRHFLQAADLYISPSDYEGFGVGIVEALATARPCLVTPVGVVPQLVRNGENGFVFPPRDLRGMLLAIDHALAERDRWPEIGRRARDAVSFLDVGTVVQQYAQLCEELVHPRQSGLQH